MAVVFDGLNVDLAEGLNCHFWYILYVSYFIIVGSSPPM